MEQEKEKTTPLHHHPNDIAFYPHCKRCQLERAAPGLLAACKDFVFLEKTNMTKKQVQLQIDRAKDVIAQATEKK